MQAGRFAPSNFLHNFKSKTCFIRFQLMKRCAPIKCPHCTFLININWINYQNMKFMVSSLKVLSKECTADCDW